MGYGYLDNIKPPNNTLMVTLFDGLFEKFQLIPTTDTVSSIIMLFLIQNGGEGVETEPSCYPVKELMKPTESAAHYQKFSYVTVSLCVSIVSADAGYVQYQCVCVCVCVWEINWKNRALALPPAYTL